MVHFKKMWEDVCSILNKKQLDDVKILEIYDSGFIIKTKEGTEFIAKDDFVDFWCHMLCFKKMTPHEMERGKSHEKYVCNVVKNLPYINETDGVISLTE